MNHICDVCTNVQENNNEWHEWMLLNKVNVTLCVRFDPKLVPVGNKKTNHMWNCSSIKHDLTIKMFNVEQLLYTSHFEGNSLGDVRLHISTRAAWDDLEIFFLD